MDDMNDDVWDEQSPEDIGKETRIRLAHLREEGFREGAAETNEAKFQEGYNTGFGGGLQVGIEWGTCEGLLEAYKHFKSTMALTPTEMQALDQASAKISGITSSSAFITHCNWLIDKRIAEIKQSANSDSGPLPTRLEAGDVEVGPEINEVKHLVKQIGLT